MYTMCSRFNTDPEAIQQSIDSVTLPAWFDPVFNRYERTIGDRDRLLWKWLYHIIPTFQLSSVPETYTDAARNANFGMSVYMTILDDIAERHCDRPLFEAGRQIPFSKVTPRAPADDDGAVLSLLEKVWEQTESFLAKGPRTDEFREILEFDLRQSLNTMEYNRLVNTDPRIVSCRSIDRRDVYNMLLFIYTDIDLAFSPRFDRNEHAAFRDFVWDTQRLARISNWVTTWEREVHEGDYTSKVVLRAVERGIVTMDGLDNNPDDAIARIQASDIESELLAEWDRRYTELQSNEIGLASIDAAAFLDGIQYIRMVDEALRGKK